MTPEPIAFIALVGPTAIGKSDLALRLASRLPLEIVNADSRQIYRYMDIGTSKPTPNERVLVPHHVYNVVDPDEEFSLADYQRHAHTAMTTIGERGRVPLLVGGSGQYVWSLVEGWQLPEVPPDRAFRREMEEWTTVHGCAALHDRLACVDADAASHIQATNVRRVIRALELHRATGVPPSLLLRRRAGVSRNVLLLGLSIDKTTLLSRADARIDTMVRHGFPDEVRALLGRGYAPTLPAMSSIGYREMVEYVNGVIDLDTATSRIRRETRRLVRRQYTWFGLSDERIMWLDARDPNAAADAAAQLIEGATR